MYIFKKDILAGQCALVTGAARGIGRSIAIALAEAGADIAAVDRGNTEAAEETVAQIEALGRKAVLYLCDVTDFAAAEKILNF